MWLSLPEEKSREHRNVNTTIFNHDLFLDMVFSHLPLFFISEKYHGTYNGGKKNTIAKEKLEKIIIFAEK